ncbi:MAG TPA: 4-hydroxy-3-methylbut-2-enyl diphosphate reductase [Salinivirgaceae bacterium]|nr:4-hydroxy-3-methylbut-2-enyl diphosphate reductase [Salinivirgaceae bacterium]HQA76031.1 4-hydroxy-3-methylbut-2-enyl diphosphate reductase [Salinivirgaceae bacterium]
MIKVTIDPLSGFCFGVVTAVDRVDKFLAENPNEKLFCLGSIMHNAEEVRRLEKKGMVTINHQDITKMKPAHIMIRAHGEPPSTYELVEKHGHQLIDATCPVVLKLQHRIKQSFIENPDSQIVIFGKKGHAEVIGLQGQTNNKAIVISDKAEIQQHIDPLKPIILFSQTTMPQDKFKEVSEILKSYCKAGVEVNDSICKRVSNREIELREFVEKHDVVVFISGKDSSNGNLLYKACLQKNPNTYFVSSVNELKREWFLNNISVGICGATSTPLWLMEKVALEIQNYFKNN